MGIDVFIQGKKRLDRMVVARALARKSWKRGILMTEKHHMAAILSIELGLVATSEHGIPQNVSLLSFWGLKKGHTLPEPKEIPTGRLLPQLSVSIPQEKMCPAIFVMLIWKQQEGCEKIQTLPASFIQIIANGSYSFMWIIANDNGQFLGVLSCILFGLVQYLIKLTPYSCYDGTIYI